ncbi:MAG: 5,6-dimethylbenzimidazole synthase [Telluria sp.]
MPPPREAANPNAFSAPEVDAVYRAIRERRDMRHFTGGAIAPDQLLRFIGAAHMGPSVGLMQPWRFMRVADPALRQLLHQHVDAERILTALALGERADEFMKLKVEGMLSCAELLVVGLIDRREEFIFGRRTMPEMDLASAACAIQNFWLAARAEGIGVGWVSLFDPVRVRALCGMPDDSAPIAILCVGQVEQFYAAPMLEIERWDHRRMLEDIIYQDAWGRGA